MVSANNTLGNEIQAPSSASGVQSTPSIATLSNGNFVVAWVDPSNSNDIKSRVFDSTGTAVSGSEFTVNATTTGAQTAPSVAGLSNGNYVVTWRDPANSGDIFARIVSATGTVSSELTVAGGAASQTAPKVAALSGGGFVVVYQEVGATEGSVTDSSTEGNVYGVRYDNSGTVTGQKFLVNSLTLGSQVSPTITALANGGFAVGWASNT